MNYLSPVFIIYRLLMRYVLLKYCFINKIEIIYRQCTGRDLSIDRVDTKGVIRFLKFGCGHNYCCRKDSGSIGGVSSVMKRKMYKRHKT